LGLSTTIDGLDPRAPSVVTPPLLDLLRMAPMSHLLDKVGQREGACLNSSTRHDGPDTIDRLRKTSGKRMCPEAFR